MFVEIDNTDMDVFQVEKWINETRDANGGVITPEFAMEILGKTNHFAHIKKVINNIKKSCSDKNGKLVADKVLAYKDFILASVDEREVSPQTMMSLQELANVCGCNKEFMKIDKKLKFYEKTDCYNAVVIKSEEEFADLNGKDLKVILDVSGKLNLYRYDLKDISALKFGNNTVVYFFPTRVTNNGLKVVHRKGLLCLPEIVDFSSCSKIVGKGADFSKVKFIKFKDEEQKDMVMYNEETFSGKIIYEDDKKKMMDMPMNNNGMEI